MKRSARAAVRRLGQTRDPVAWCRLERWTATTDSARTAGRLRRGLDSSVQLRNVDDRHVVGNGRVWRDRQVRRRGRRASHRMIAAGSAVRNVALAARLEWVVIGLRDDLRDWRGEIPREVVLGGSIRAERQEDVVIDQAVIIGVAVGKAPSVAGAGRHDVVEVIMMLVPRPWPRPNEFKRQGQTDCDDRARHRDPPCFPRTGSRPRRPGLEIERRDLGRAGTRIRPITPTESRTRRNCHLEGYHLVAATAVAPTRILFRLHGLDVTIQQVRKCGFQGDVPGRVGSGRSTMILLIDNYDSFTYNLVQRLGEIDPASTCGSSATTRSRSTRSRLPSPTHLIISPGPCTPVQAGISNDVVARFAPAIPLLGVCLGHQCIGHAFGAKIVRADRIMHGKTSLIHHDGRGVYRGLSNPFEATRYHSLVIQPGTLPGRSRSRRLDRPG